MAHRTYHIVAAPDGWLLRLDGLDIARSFRSRDEALQVADLMAQHCPSARVRVYYADSTLDAEYCYHGEPRHVRC
jgi:hypothetical protein